MTKNDIINLARTVNEHWWLDDIDLENFAALVAAAEREACAKVCEEGGKDASGRIHVQAWGAAKAIRARKEMK